MNGMVVLMFVFLTTPSAGIQLLLRNRLAMMVIGKFFQEGEQSRFLIFFRSYLTVGLTILFNLMFLFLIVVIARNNRFTKYSRFHTFVLNYTFVYLLLNMVIIPALALSFGNSIFEFLNSHNLKLEKVVNSFYLIDYGSFFINIVLQSSSFIVLTDLNRVVELLDAGFSTNVAHLFRQGYKSHRFKSKEVNSFKIGYNYAESCAIGVMVLFIGLYSPLLFICGGVFYIFKYCAHSPLIVSVFDKEEEDFGSLLRNAVGKLYVGLLLGHFFLFVVCTLTGNFATSGANLCLLVGGLVNIFYLVKLADVKKVLKEDRTVTERSFTALDLEVWREMFAHPVDKRLREMSLKSD